MVKNEKGWTMTELLICCAIVGAIALVGPQLLNGTTKYFILGRARIDVQREARASMYNIERQLREAQSATITDRSGRRTTLLLPLELHPRFQGHRRDSGLSKWKQLDSRRRRPRYQHLDQKFSVHGVYIPAFG